MAHFLLRSQQNDVLRVIQETDLDPIEFRWEQRTSRFTRDSVPVLVHAPSSASFTFDFANGQHFATYVPGQSRPLDHYGAGANWEGQLGYVRQWLGYLKREHFAPDLWGELGKAKELAAAAGTADEDNSLFTAEEQSEISNYLREIKELLTRTEQLEGDRLRAVEARLAYLEDASTRLGRRDWLTLLYGTVMSWGLSAVVSPDGARQVLMTAAHTLGHLFGGGFPQLGA